MQKFKNVSIGNVAHRLLSDLFSIPKDSKKFIYERLVLNWENIIGYHQAQQAFPRKLAFSKQGATLYLEVCASSLLEFTYGTESLIACINEFFGYTMVRHIMVQQSLKMKNKMPCKQTGYDNAHPISETSSSEEMLQEDVLPSEYLPEICSTGLRKALFHLEKVLEHSKV